MEPATANLFWQVTSMIAPDQLTIWTKEVIGPIEEARYKKKGDDPNKDKTSKITSVRNWFFGKKKEETETPDANEEPKEGPGDAAQ